MREARDLVSSQAGRVVALALAVLVVCVCVGMVVLWPADDLKAANGAAGQKVYLAKVTAVSERACDLPPGVSAANRTCLDASIRLLSGPAKGDDGELAFDAQSTAPTVGSKIRVLENPSVATDEAIGGGLAGDEELGPPGSPAGGELEAQPASGPTYSFVDFDRTGSMLILVALFVGIALLVSRLRAARSLLGLAVSLLIVLKFIVPSILDGNSPLAVAVIGSLAIMMITMVLAHGVSLKSAAAAIGTTAALLVTITLAQIFTESARLTGFTSEDTAFLEVGQGLSLQGLLLAGIVIAALGVLDDLTVSQASTVLALRRESPHKRWSQLYRAALDVGHDHIAATINTLVLAYVGASLPLLLVFTIGDLPWSDTVNSEVIAEQIVGTLVGSIGLITAVPLTTALAAALAVRTPVALIPAEAHAHAH